MYAANSSLSGTSSLHHECTHSSIFYTVCTSRMAASFRLSAMHDANSSVDNLISASLISTISSLHGNIAHPSKLHRFTSNLAPCLRQTPPFLGSTGTSLEAGTVQPSPWVVKLLSLDDYILAHPLNLHREAFVCFFFEVTTVFFIDMTTIPLSTILLRKLGSIIYRWYLTKYPWSLAWGWMKECKHLLISPPYLAGFDYCEGA